MAKTFDKQTEDARISELSFEERFGLIVDAEWTTRRNNRLKRLIRGANFTDVNACVENVEYHSDRNLDKDLERVHTKPERPYFDEFPAILRQNFLKYVSMSAKFFLV